MKCIQLQIRGGYAIQLSKKFNNVGILCIVLTQHCHKVHACYTLITQAPNTQLTNGIVDVGGD